jgi:Bacterial Ig domain
MSQQPKLNANERVQLRSTQTAGNPADASWKILWDSGAIPQPITVSNVTATTPAGQAITVSLSAVDPTANAIITFDIGTKPKDGTLSAIVNNAVTYTPNANFNGIDTFTYTAADQTGLVSAQGIVTITVGTAPANSMGTVAVINLSTKATDAQVASWVAAVQQQANTDVAAEWGNTVTMVIVPSNITPPTADWYCGIFDNTDQAGALGWHAVGKNNEPLIEIFVETSQQAGVAPESVLSHEIIESIGDANADTIVSNCLTSTGQTCEMFRELCDAVEDNSYQIQGLSVSDFVTKNWFVQGSAGPWDHLAQTTKPFQLLPGGYMEYSVNGGATWVSETQGGAMKAYRDKIGEYSRWTKYKTPITERKRSTF